MSRTRVPIGVASIRSGVKVPTIRYYENIGLLPAPPRTKSNRRNYDAADLRRLVFIRHARELGFEIDAIRTLLSIQDNPDQSCEGVDAIARARLGEVERRIEILLKLRTELKRMIAGCSRGRVAQCRIIEALATPTPAGILADFDNRHLRPLKAARRPIIDPTLPTCQRGVPASRQLSRLYRTCCQRSRNGSP